MSSPQVRRYRGADGATGWLRSARRRLILPILVTAAVAAVFSPAGAGAVEEPEPWLGVEDGRQVVELYFVFSSTCPHCRAAIPYIEDLEQQRDWLRVWWIQADSDDEAAKTVAIALASEIGTPIQAVPTFMFCGEMVTGYDGPEGIGAQIAERLDACHAATVRDTPVTTTTIEDVAIAVPGVGDLRSSAVPLPVFTILVAGLDAFNPCAFFVLLFLLSLLVHARNRFRMAAIGVLFVAISGILYFIFMSAWLNLFLITDNLRWVTIGAGALAAVLGAISIKDSYRPGGMTTSIPESAKPGLYARTRNLVRAENMLAVAGATVALAIVANSYELLCTAGLPMAFTRVLTLSDLPTPTYYGYLALYNVVYVIPLLAIVAGFVWTLGSRKLQPREGRALKLLSGTMMLGLGAALLFAPQLLERVTTAVVIVAAAVAATLVMIVLERLVRRSTPTVSGT
ncbi:MAG: thioredoxin family protein [Acidimicrobiia bacterium]|nr:thioredoxin family protein [Acidimicrobiia bacterium]